MSYDVWKLWTLSIHSLYYFKSVLTPPQNLVNKRFIFKLREEHIRRGIKNILDAFSAKSNEDFKYLVLRQGEKQQEME